MSTEHPPPIAPHPTLREYYENETSRQRFVSDLFDTTSRHYEWLDRVLSFGSGLWYRKDALRRAGLTTGMRLLDVATGTGGVARAAVPMVGPDGGITCLDASFGMLREAGGLTRVQSLGEVLPFASGSFDFLSMGYALRHLSDLHAAFSEFRRVLRPGATLLLLEITAPRSRPAYHLLRFYMKGIVPLAAKVSTGSAETATLMRYYWDTTAACVPPETILVALREAGFRDAKRTVTLGLFSDYTARC